jgi:hypothetical protein
MNLKASQHNTFKVGTTKLYMNVTSIENASNSFDIFLERCYCARYRLRTCYHLQILSPIGPCTGTKVGFISYETELLVDATTTVSTL